MPLPTVSLRLRARNARCNKLLELLMTNNRIIEIAITVAVGNQSNVHVDFYGKWMRIRRLLFDSLLPG